MQDRIGNITLVGSSHIAQQSVKEIRQAFSENSFSLVGVELDQQRLRVLLTNQTGGNVFKYIRHFGLRVGLFATISSLIQKQMGRMVGLQPGIDMKTAVLEAQVRNLPVACIDQHIAITFRKLRRHLGFGLYFSFVRDMIESLIFPKRYKKYLPTTKVALQKVPSQELIDAAMHLLKKKYPGLFSVLVHERNHIMANNIFGTYIKFEQKPMLVVVGAGHFGEIKRLLEDRMRGSVINIRDESFDEQKVSYKDSKIHVGKKKVSLT